MPGASDTHLSLCKAFDVLWGVDSYFVRRPSLEERWISHKDLPTEWAYKLTAKFYLQFSFSNRGPAHAGCGV